MLAREGAHNSKKKKKRREKRGFLYFLQGKLDDAIPGCFPDDETSSSKLTRLECSPRSEWTPPEVAFFGLVPVAMPPLLDPLTVDGSRVVCNPPRSNGFGEVLPGQIISTEHEKKLIRCVGEWYMIQGKALEFQPFKIQLLSYKYSIYFYDWSEVDTSIVAGGDGGLDRLLHLVSEKVELCQLVLSDRRKRINALIVASIGGGGGIARWRQPRVVVRSGWAPAPWGRSRRVCRPQGRRKRVGFRRGGTRGRRIPRVVVWKKQQHK